MLLLGLNNFLIKACVLSHVRLFVTSWTVANHGQIPLSLEFSRQEYWSETGVSCHFLLQGIFLTEGFNPHLAFLHWQAILYQLSHWGSPK